MALLGDEAVRTAGLKAEFGSASGLPDVELMTEF